MTKFVWVVGRRMGGGFRAEELCVLCCSPNGSDEQPHECREAVDAWLKKHALTYVIHEVMP